MRFPKTRRIMALSAVAALAACANPNVQAPAAADSGLQTEIEQQLAQSAARAANAQETLAMIQRARTAPAAPALDETGLPPELKRPTTVKWAGPASEVVRQLAAQIGYSFTVSGNPPGAPPLVNVDIHDESAAKALEEIGLQVQNFATVVVDPNLRRVEFRYETAEGHPAPAAHRVLRRRAWHPAARHARPAHGTCEPCAAAKAAEAPKAPEPSAKAPPAAAAPEMPKGMIPVGPAGK